MVGHQKDGNGVSHCADCGHYRWYRRWGAPTCNPHDRGRTVERVGSDDVNNRYSEHHRAHGGYIHNTDAARVLVVYRTASSDQIVGDHDPQDHAIGDAASQESPSKNNPGDRQRGPEWHGDYVRCAGAVTDG
jgi:hypothetical protein